jgi:ribose/xylose/arabinose/galactoside ABC-type transport system permease subunit
MMRHHVSGRKEIAVSDPGQVDFAAGGGSAVSGAERPARRQVAVPGLGALIAFLGPNVGAVVGLLLIVVAGTLVSDVFLSWTNIRNVFLQSAMLGVVALGMTFVILTGGIDLSVGSVLSLCSVIAAMMYNNGEGYSLPVVLLATLAVGAAIGALNGGIIVWRQVAPFIVTLAMMGIALGAALTIADGKPIGGIDGTYAWLGAGRIAEQIPVPVVIMVVSYIIGAIVLRYTPYGRAVFAVGGNEQAARLSGIPVNRVKVLTYIISGFCAGLGAIIFSARVTVGDPWAGRSLELDAIAAVVIGGTSLFGGIGSVWGTFLGTLIITIVNNLLNLMNVSPYTQGIAKGLIILIAIALYKRRAE